MTGGPRTDLEAEGVLDAALALLAQLRERGLQVDRTRKVSRERVVVCLFKFLLFDLLNLHSRYQFSFPT